MSDDVLSSYDYNLPADLIAEEPLPRRDASRMLVLDRHTGDISHRQFSDFPEQLQPNDLLVLNETRVVPARLQGQRTLTGGKWEGLFLGLTESGCWRLIGHTRGSLRVGECLTLRRGTAAEAADDAAATLELRLIARGNDGEWLATPGDDAPAFTLLDRFGTVPLPPYIRRLTPTERDRERYQTTFARTPGAIAAPTAGLHFTPQILERCKARGANLAFVTLHVGLGTFRPVNVENLGEHVMHHEWCHLPQETVAAIAAARHAGGRVIAVGTTTVRTLESVAARGPLAAWSGETDLFIRPPYDFRVVDALLTNFHLPKSTLLMLMAAFAGRSRLMDAYSAAIEARYRFFSYGDAMFVG